MELEKLSLQVLQEPQGGHLAGGRNDVVGGLAVVYVVVGMHQGIIALGAAQDINGAVGDDLVGVHVHRRARAALNGIHDKVIVQPAVDNFVAGFYDGGGNFLVQETCLAVSDGGSLLNVSEAVDKFRVHGQSGDVKVLRGTEALHSIVDVFRNILGSDGILFHTIVVFFVFLIFLHILLPPMLFRRRTGRPADVPAVCMLSV